MAHLQQLSRWGAAQAAAAAGVVVPPTRPARSGRTVSIHLPPTSEDPTIRAIEERIAEATGIPIHPDEEPLGVRHTSSSSAAECAERFCTALHVDTNQGGYYRCATVLLYLHEVVGSGAAGGETRFPLVGAPKHSPLREAAERLADIGVTAFSPGEEIEWPPLACRAALFAAAEAGGGFRVRPQPGLAAVFWTHTADGLDPYSWHTGARLPPEATEGKLLAQKFKSLPVEWRPKERGGVVRLPAELAPPDVVMCAG